MAGCGDPDDEENSFGWSDANKPASTGVIDLNDNETRNRIAAEAIDSGKLQKKGEEGDQLYYAPNQQTAYTGWAKRIWDNGQIKALGQINDGKEEGLWTEWYESGNKLTEVNYKDGKMEGVGTLWYENGKKQTESNYKNGKHNGLWKHWFENGQKKGEGNFKDGKPNGLATLWYENGQKQRETNFKNGESMPLVWTAFVWKPNGEKCPITNINNGNGVLVDYYEDGTEKNRLTFKDGEIVLD
jgi:antitoxin component YwqK of YwqJK toxin-antitoxin module